jgi:hypothetical protein
MRVVEYRGRPVKRQRKIGSDQILLTYYDRPPEVVSVSEWESFANNKYYSASVRRCEVVRNSKPKKVNDGYDRDYAAAAR